MILSVLVLGFFISVVNNWGKSLSFLISLELGALVIMLMFLGMTPQIFSFLMIYLVAASILGVILFMKSLSFSGMDYSVQEFRYFEEF